MEKYYEQSRPINALEPRAYYIPFGTSKAVFSPRAKSDRFTSLNGQWSIEEYASILDVADDFYLSKPKDTIPVPSCVQIHGYDQIQYLNTAFPFVVNPPFVNNENPSYHYARYFTAKADGNKKYVCFEGVDSCFYLYINNKFVGFSQVAHRLSEFDITDFIVDGENKIDVLVLKWCFGSYLECQDKRRFTGIFRDVYILSRPQNHIVDYRIDTKMDGTVTFELEEGASASVTLDGKTKKVKEGETIEFKIKNPKLWSAENPYLYEMLIESNGEYIGEKVGVREVEIKGGIYLINGQPVKMCGVNRHDIHPENGATVTVEDIVNDIKLMKKLNVNAIRTSHYPNMPEFYQICDEMGVYVMSESDVEMHGVCCKIPYYAGYGNSYNDYANDPLFEEATVDRQKCNVLLNKNRPSIVFWSLGNEAGYGTNFVSATAWIKSYDKTRPVHYERAISIPLDENGGRAYFESAVDVVSSMYPTIQRVHNILNEPRESRPFILCEYCHSMGNGPGDFKAYWDIIDNNDRFIGGYVWEWADHGLWNEEKTGFLYGGDHGSFPNDGNFCMDGIVTADRQLTQKSLEMKKVYEPVRFTYGMGKLTVKSRWFFENVKGTLTVTYKNGGKVVGEEKFALDLAPQQTIEYTVKREHVIIASLTLDEKWQTLEKGFEVAKEGWTDTNVKMDEGVEDCAVTFEEKGRYIVVNAGETTFTLNKANAEISINKGGEVLEKPLALSIWRAPTDNDMYIRKQWEEAYFYMATSEVRDIQFAGNSVIFKGYMTAPTRLPSVFYTLTYTFSKDAVTTYIDYKCSKYVDYLPRIGLVTALDKAYEKVDYYGYGPYESYIDRRISCIKDVYSDTVTNMEVDYVMPQENGSHYGTEWVELSGGKHTIRVEGNFSFSALPHSVREYTDAKHDFELPKREYTHLSLDYFMAGIGSNSCGPELDAQWKTPKEARAKFTVKIK